MPDGMAPTTKYFHRLLTAVCCSHNHDCNYLIHILVNM